MTCPALLPLAILRHRSEFLAVAHSGRKWVTPGLILQIGPNASPDSGKIHYGLTASKKVGCAVIRNRARRRLRALAGEIFSTQAAPQWRYVIIARGTTAERPYEQLRQDLQKALLKLGVQRAP